MDQSYKMVLDDSHQKCGYCTCLYWLTVLSIELTVVLHCDVIFPPLCGVDVCHLGTGGLGECTFLLVKWWQNTVVLANLEVDFLLNPVRDRSLWNDDTHTCTVMR